MHLKPIFLSESESESEEDCSLNEVIPRGAGHLDTEKVIIRARKKSFSMTINHLHLHLEEDTLNEILHLKSYKTRSQL